MTILERIDQPSDLRRLSSEELDTLAQEIREFLVASVSQTGGHLSSNLGTVELTLALHRTFDSPRDKLVWDVGHQGYVHKLVTGRRDRFDTIRQYEGLCGFLERVESEHDQFGAGHAGTSISAALGMAMARDIQDDDYHVVAVIGDGSLTAGMALEALNHAGHQGTRLIVLLNDNEMSISPNVGAIGRALNVVRLNPGYSQAKTGAEKVFHNLPLGDEVWKAGERLKRSMKGMLVPSMLWESLGFDYIGPIDGHNRAELEAALQQARDVVGKPVFLHVLTVKGKGYDAAESDSIKWHGVSPASNSAPPVTPPPPTYSRVFASTFSRIANENRKVVAITAAMLEGTALSSITATVPARQVIDVGICEQHAVTLAAGLATQGVIPVVAIYSTFLQRGYDQLVHDVALQNLHVVFAMDRAGIVGDDGKTHQGIFDISFLRPIPNLVIAAPRDEDELQHLLWTGIEHDGPFVIRFPRGAGQGVPMASQLRRIRIGQAETLRSGNDITIVATGSEVYPALQAAEELAALGIACDVIDARWIKPLDAETILESVGRTGRVVTVEENVLAGGFGSAVMELLQTSNLELPVLRLGLPDRFIEHGTQKILRNKYGVDAQSIVTRVKEFVSPVSVERVPVPR